MDESTNKINSNEEVVDNDYFTSYEDVEIHKLMLDDRPRTEAYQKAILSNSHLFRDKIVMDIGAGSGILSLFAMQAGAKKVYAIEASDMAIPLRKIVELNDHNGIIQVVKGKAEEINLNEKVDVIISEWMGFYLLHESMLNSVIKARDKHLEDNDGIMFPSHCTLYTAPCSLEKQNEYWKSVYGFNMTPLGQIKSKKPEIITLGPSQILSDKSKMLELDLRWVTEDEITSFSERKFVAVDKDATFQGIALWFDCTFNPSVFSVEDDNNEITPVVLSTDPKSDPTHWKQTVIVIPSTSVEKGEIVGWSLNLCQCSSNHRQYAIQLEILDPATEEHPVPCGCQMAKCALIKALMDKEDEQLLS